MSLGIWQILLILIIVLLVFGAGKLPRVMGDLGKGVRSMRDGLNTSDKEDDSVIDGKAEHVKDADKK